MTIQFVITIDTEEDQWDKYSTQLNTVENINRLMPLQDIFNKYNAIPTYLINWPVINDPKSLQTIKKLLNEHNCEIGTHCHPWNTPPFGEKINEPNSMMCNLPYEVIEKKMNCLHEAIMRNLNIEPLCFRAGRWGFGANVAKCIQLLSYKVDSSVTPFVDWSIYHGPDFNNASTFPYHFKAEDILKQSIAGPLFEVPPSVGFFQQNFKICNRIRKIILSSGLSKLRLLGVLDKLRLLNQRWLSPEVSSANDMIILINSLIRNGHKVLNFTFHSTTLLPGKSPYVQSEEGLKNFIKRIEVILAYCIKNNFKFIPLSMVKDVR